MNCGSWMKFGCNMKHIAWQWVKQGVNDGILVIRRSLIKAARFGLAKRNVLIGSQPMKQCTAKQPKFSEFLKP